MLTLNILLEKLYRHKSDLEFMMSIRAKQDRAGLKCRYNSCLNNIRIYERQLKLKTGDSTLS